MNFTNIKNIKYSKADNSTIDLLATCKEIGEVPMTLNIVDTEDNHHFSTGKFEIVIENRMVLEKQTILENGAEKEIEVLIEKEVEVQKEIFIPLEEYCKTLEIAPYVEPEPVIVIPNSVTKLQAKLQLLEIGLLDDVETLIEQDIKVKLYWTDSQNFLRTDEIILGIATALGLSDAQLDDLFLKASKL